jgi:hypothetical protein
MRCNPKMLNHTRLATVAAVGDGSVGRDGVPCLVPMHPRPGHHQSRQQPQFNEERDVPQARKVTPQCEAAHKGRPYRLLNSLRVPEFRWRMSDQDLLWPSSSPARLRVHWPQRSKTVTTCALPAAWTATGASAGTRTRASASRCDATVGRTFGPRRINHQHGHVLRRPRGSQGRSGMKSHLKVLIAVSATSVLADPFGIRLAMAQPSKTHRPRPSDPPKRPMPCNTTVA